MTITTAPPTLSFTDVLAHEQSSHVTWPARTKFFRNLDLNGRIRTAGDQLLADQVGEWASVEVTVEYVSPVSPDGDVYLIVAGLDGAGRALAVTDASERGDAASWMYRDLVALLGKATVLHGQPGIDLRRATFEAVA
jgi:hypothetical protein